MKMLLTTLVSLLAVNAFAGSDSRYAYQISNSDNCKLMYDYGHSLRFSERIVDYHWCAPVAGMGRGGDAPFVQYEWSNKGNCKIMINRQFSNQFAPDWKCQVND